MCCCVAVLCCSVEDLVLHRHVLVLILPSTKLCLDVFSVLYSFSCVSLCYCCCVENLVLHRFLPPNVCLDLRCVYRNRLPVCCCVTVCVVVLKVFIRFDLLSSSLDVFASFLSDCVLRVVNLFCCCVS